MARYEKKDWRLDEQQLYAIYNGIIYRCYNTKWVQYHCYWWRWIKCEWDTFEEFYNDMQPIYIKWYSVDRIDNDWNYSKENCRWITRSENSRKANKDFIPETNLYEEKRRPFDPLDVLFDDCWLNIKWYCWEKKKFVDDIEIIDWIEIHTYYEQVPLSITN